MTSWLLLKKSVLLIKITVIIRYNRTTETFLSANNTVEKYGRALTVKNLQSGKRRIVQRFILSSWKTLKRDCQMFEALFNSPSVRFFSLLSIAT